RLRWSSRPSGPTGTWKDRRRTSAVPSPYAGTNRIRLSGLRTLRTLSAVGAPRGLPRTLGECRAPCPGRPGRGRSAPRDDVPGEAVRRERPHLVAGRGEARVVGEVLPRLPGDEPGEDDEADEVGDRHEP